MAVTLEMVHENVVRLNNKVTTLLSKPQKKTWVDVGIIKELTGRNGSEELKTLRDNNLVEFDPKTKRYNLESLHPLMIKQR